MIRDNSLPVAILGGGLAGLTAAAHLAQHRVPFVLHESAGAVAGLCRSERDDEGFTFDCGVHFITNRLAAAVGIASRCLPMARYGETVHLRGRKYSYPLGLMATWRYLGSALAAKAMSPLARRARTAREHYRKEYGGRLAEEIALPLTEAWSGLESDRIAAAVGEKFATSLPRMLMLRAEAWATSRVVGIGYAGTIAESSHAWHVYPESGIADVCRALHERVEPHVRLNSRVEEIRVEDDSVVAIVANGQETPVAGVVSTAPVPALASMVRGSNVLDEMRRFRYRAMVFVNLKLSGPSGMTDVVTWTPESQFPFFRVSDIGMGLPWLVPSGKSQVTCDIGCQIGDTTWNTTDAELTETCVAGIEEIVPGARARLLGSRIVRVPLAYPIFDVDYEAARKRFADNSGIDGLISVGRNGEFAHILMEDVFWRTRWKVSSLLERITGY